MFKIDMEIDDSLKDAFNTYKTLKNLDNTFVDIIEKLKVDAIKNAPKKSGKLKESIDNDINDFLEYSMFSTVDYAYEVEFGTIKMPPRPFFFLSVENNKKYIQTQINKSLAKSLKQSGWKIKMN